jgi:hypothetical protein
MLKAKRFASLRTLQSLSRGRRAVLKSSVTGRYHPGLIPAGPAQKKPAVRHAAQTIRDLRTCLRGYPPYMKVEVKRDVPVIAKTVGDLRSLSTWPPGLILNFPDPATVILRAS